MGKKIFFFALITWMSSCHSHYYPVRLAIINPDSAHSVKVSVAGQSIVIPARHQSSFIYLDSVTALREFTVSLDNSDSIVTRSNVLFMNSNCDTGTYLGRVYYEPRLKRYVVDVSHANLMIVPPGHTARFTVNP